MALISIIRAVLVLLMPIYTVAQLNSRQHTLNGTATPTVNSGQAASMTTAPPCCWIVIGEFAVGYNNWYSSTAEQVVAQRQRGPNELHYNTRVLIGIPRDGPSMPGVPTDLLTGNYGGAEYAGTYIDAATVVSFAWIDLAITQPTPFDHWMRIGIYTETPNASLHSFGSFSTWPATVCGTYSTYTEYSFTSWTVNTGSTESVHRSRVPTATHTLLQPSDPLNSLRFHNGDSGNYTDRLATLNATYIQAKSTQFTEERLQLAVLTNILDWLATQEEVTKKYPYIKNCWLGPKGTGQPTAHVPVMALTVTSSTFLDLPETPAVKPADKGSMSSVTTKSAIHTIVTVMTSTASSDASTTTLVESKQSSPDAAGPESTGEPQSEVEEPESDAVDADSSPTAQPDTEEQSQDPEAEDSSLTFETASGQPTASEDHSTSSVHKGVVSDPVDSATTTQPKSTASPTTGFIEGVMSVIRSVAAQQGGVSQAEPSSEDSQQNTKIEPVAVIPAAKSEERPAESVTGFAIGTRIASPGGEAVTRGGSVYSALPSGSGLRVEADGQTSTIADAVFPGIAVAQHSASYNDYIVGDNTLTAGGPAITSDGITMSALPAGSGVRIAANGQTTIIPAAASTDSVTLRPGDSGDEYILAGNSLSAGEDAVGFAGVTYPALKSGSGIIVMAEDSTSTLSVGQVFSASFASESDLDYPSPLLLPAGSQQLVLSSVNIYTASAVSNASDEISKAIDTATATNSAQETRTSSSTHGLGDAIISGIGGGNAGNGNGDGNNPDPQSSTDVEAASHATRRSVHALFGGVCALAFALALL